MLGSFKVPFCFPKIRFCPGPAPFLQRFGEEAPLPFPWILPELALGPLERTKRGFEEDF